RGAKAGLSQRVIKPGQVFNRIHRDDIVKGLNALLHTDNPPQIVNFSDDEPSPPQDVIAYAAKLLKVDPPPEIPFEQAELSPMGRSFYQDNKRLRNDRLKTLMGSLSYPTYREGLKALLP
ncbi:MAG: NAD(P)-dependent oxidoreductase, partial [Pseudomonadota bacterium]